MIRISQIEYGVRTITNLFKKNIQQLGLFSSNMSVDESIIKFFGRCIIKQFMKNKPIRFGLKLWCLYTVSGFLLDFDTYCGKQETETYEILKNYTLDTKVVMKMPHEFFKSVPSEKLAEYHVVFDNFFTSPDLVVHLRKLGVKSTGTVKQNRVYEKKVIKNKEKREVVPISLDKKSVRGAYEVKHDEESGIHYIIVMDSKIVSILTGAVGVTPL